MSFGVERVLVIPRGKVLEDAGWQGIATEGMETVIGTVGLEGEYLPRHLVEENSRFKQIIPYIIFRHGERFLLMQRTDKGGEHRLHNKYSLGIGGHIREEDMEGKDVFGWAKREFGEEVDYSGGLEVEAVGVLNDDSNEVGLVHLGIVLLVTGDVDSISVKDEHSSGELLTLREMEQFRDDMEDWSRIVFDYLVGSDIGGFGSTGKKVV